MRIFLILQILPIILYAREWTVLVYMAADNSLSAFADSDLAEMKSIGSDDNLAIVVQVDKPYIGANRYYVAKDTLYNLKSLFVIDMCDWKTLRDFLEWGVRFFPAKRYFIILWDHGAGWTSMPRRTFGSDWSSGTEMSIANGDLRHAFKDFYEAMGEKFDIIAFDACNMQQIEIENEIKDYGKTILAPQTVWPIDGFPYENIFYIFKTEPGINEIDLGKEIIEICKDYYTTQSSAISFVNLERIGKLIEFLKEDLNLIIQSQPDSNIRKLRNQVQTISLINPNPSIEDDFVDLGDFLRLLNSYRPTEKTQALLNYYNGTIIASCSWGTGLTKLTGITTWFPDRYIEFKNLVNSYLGLDYRKSGWPEFLNWFYGQDDIRPTTPRISNTSTGKDNDFHLFWTESFDLAPIFYNIIEFIDTVLIFGDDCEDSLSWNFNGFSLVKNISYQGNGSFFSGNSSNLNNSLTTKNNIRIDEIGLLDLYLYYNTEDMTDSFIIEHGTRRFIFYGRSGTWQNCRLVLMQGDAPLRFYYKTNGAVNNGGVYIDGIRLYSLVSGRYIRYFLSDTTLYLFNKLKGDYYYCVYAKDPYGNESDLSNIVHINVTNFGIPYSIPNPFNESCEIVLDFPDECNPWVYIYSITGRLVKKFPPSAVINKKVHWNGKDFNDNQVGSGLYFVLIKDKDFNKIGKIARQR